MTSTPPPLVPGSRWQVVAAGSLLAAWTVFLVVMTIYG
jgi:hypothetical protein